MLWRNVFLGIDIGTTSVKAALVTDEEKCIAQATEEYQTKYIRPGWVEQNPWEWWKATTNAVHRLGDKNEEALRSVKAVSISSQAPTLMGIDSEGMPVGDALIWMDQRAQEVCRRRLMPYERLIREYAGNRIDPYYMLPKLLWQEEQRPEQYRAVETYLQINGWIAYLLTGVRSIDKTHAALTQLADIHTMRWNTPFLSELGIAGIKLPEIYDCSAVVGRILPQPAKSWGIAEGTPVVAGCIDGAAAPYGLGLCQAGERFEMSGQSSGLGIITDHPQFQPNLCLLKHVLEGQWILKGSMSCSGGTLKWFRDEMDEKPGDATCYQRYDELAAQSRPGANGVWFLPYLNGERAPLWNPALRGLWFGFGVDTKKADMIRAMMEGTAYALKTIQDEFPEDMAGRKSMFGTGGGYKSGLWSQIKADVLECEIDVRQSGLDAAVTGSARLAMRAVGCNVDQNIQKAIQEAAPKKFTPNSQNTPVYRTGYALFRQLYLANKALFEQTYTDGEAR